MLGDRSHAFITPAVYDNTQVLPAGLREDLPTRGMLMFTAHPSQALKNYDVYYSPGHIGMGPLSQPYEFIGKVRDVYAERIREIESTASLLHAGGGLYR